MPFPWKKMKSGKISRLVNDHLDKSQKRRDGSSLVVETGFPTSLIDLIIKNHEKLKSQQPKRKSRNQPIRDVGYSPIAAPPAPPPSIAGSPSPPPSVARPPRPPPSIEVPTRPAYTALRSPSPLHNRSVSPLPSPSGRVSEIPVKSSGVETVADVNRVLLGILKMFFVVVLTLATQRLTVGITLSAFLLLFLEYVGKHANHFSKPYADAKAALSSIVSRLRFDEVRLYPNPDLQIQAVESNQEIQPVNEIIEESTEESEPCLQYPETESKEKQELIFEVAEQKRKSRKAKIGSKMKKLVPKKFKKSSRKENGLQITEIVKDDNVQNEAESEIVSELSSIEDCSIARLAEVAEECSAKTEEKVLEHSGLNRRQLVICLIVLIGLIGGRIFAFALTLSWFLLLKLGQILPRFMKA